MNGKWTRYRSCLARLLILTSLSPPHTKTKREWSWRGDGPERDACHVTLLSPLRLSFPFPFPFPLISSISTLSLPYSHLLNGNGLNGSEVRWGRRERRDYIIKSDVVRGGTRRGMPTGGHSRSDTVQTDCEDHSTVQSRTRMTLISVGEPQTGGSLHSNTTDRSLLLSVNNPSEAEPFLKKSQCTENNVAPRIPGRW